VERCLACEADGSRPVTCSYPSALPEEGPGLPAYNRDSPAPRVGDPYRPRKRGSAPRAQKHRRKISRKGTEESKRAFGALLREILARGPLCFELFAIRRGYAQLMVRSFVESDPKEAFAACDKSSHSPPLACEEIVNLYLKDVDRSLIRENLRLSYVERLQRLQRNVQAANKLCGAGIRSLKIER
jgi:hypothetical protein